MAESEKPKQCCCISHEFFKSASRNPNKVAVIHARGAARICRREFDDDDDDDDEDKLFDRHRVSSSHPGFEGDEFFTFSDILDSVESLSRRICRVLDGGDDPSLVRPRGYVHSKESIHFENVVGTPRIVGIYMTPSVEYIVAVLSILRSGEAFLPLDPSWPKERVLSIILPSTVSLIIKFKSSANTTDNQLLDTFDWLEDQSSCSILYMSMKETQKKDFDRSNIVWPCESRNARTYCYLMYTSGSTGRPKGVCGTEKGLLNRYLWMQELYPLHGEEILLFKTSTSFVDHLQEFISAILACMPLVIPPSEELKANPSCIVDFLKAYCISRLTIVPSVMRAIFPALESSCSMRLKRSLRVLVFSGEILSISLCDMICKLFPETSVLNLYGSTEVSGDCTYFDCKRLPMILDSEVVGSVPIGIPIFNCDVVLVEDPNEPDEGEIYVGGVCMSTGYFHEPTMTSLKYVKFSQGSSNNALAPLDFGDTMYFETGDFVRRLQGGDLVFLGRKDRTIKINGQRVALEEIENVLRENPNVVDAAVVSHRGREENVYLVAYITLKQMEESYEMLSSSIRSWMVKRLPLAWIPGHYIYVESLPMSSSGKVDYGLLSKSNFLLKQTRRNTSRTHCEHALLQVIKEAFCDALMVEEINCDDDFFLMGGNSLSAAQLAHKLGINMSLLYIFPSPSKLLHALLDEDLPSNYEFDVDSDWEATLKRQNKGKLLGRAYRSRKNDHSLVSSKYMKVDSILYTNLNGTTSRDGETWDSSLYLSFNCSFSHCNKVAFERDTINNLQEACWSVNSTTKRQGSIRELWKVHLRSCVDASPLVVLKDGNAYLFIGSHSHIFLCVDAISGVIKWEVELEGRIECSAAIVDDFSLVVVGCYKGKIYFLDFVTGNISWIFQTQGEVKSQPIVDKQRHLIWCGSYDHNLYALDYRNHSCVSIIPCGGSIYGSPSIDVVNKMLYVASTRGLMTAISIEASPFRTIWGRKLGAPVFGSISVSSPNGNVICCLVDGHVLALNLTGSIVWKAITDGPIFGGACISSALPSQVLVCTRSGSIYSFELEEGGLLWEYNIGHPITSSAYVNENMQLISDASYPSDRLACICSSSGSIYLLRIKFRAMRERNQTDEDILDPIVQEFAKIDLPGDIFSSPLMIGGRIFVGCRDDYVRCMGVEIKTELKNG